MPISSGEKVSVARWREFLVFSARYAVPGRREGRGTEYPSRRKVIAIPTARSAATGPGERGGARQSGIAIWRNWAHAAACVASRKNARVQMGRSVVDSHQPSRARQQ